VTRPYLAGDLATLLAAPSVGVQPGRPASAAQGGPRSGAAVDNGTPARRVGAAPVSIKTAWWPGTIADWRSPRGLLAAALLVAVDLLGFLVWFVVGLLQAVHGMELSAQAVRADLDQVNSALLVGNTAEAEQAAQAANTDLRSAQVVADRPAVRLAGRLPGLSQPVEDLDRLIAAAHRVVGAAERAVMVYSQLASESPTMLRNRRFDSSCWHGRRMRSMPSTATSPRPERSCWPCEARRWRHGSNGPKRPACGSSMRWRAGPGRSCAR
jgi:hypothetical protein